MSETHGRSPPANPPPGEILRASKQTGCQGQRGRTRQPTRPINDAHRCTGRPVLKVIIRSHHHFVRACGFEQ